MSDKQEWYVGDRDYQKMSFVSDTPSNHFTLEILDTEEQSFNSIHDIFANHLTNALLPVEVLYSGGLDSECVIVSCLLQKIPVIAVTLRMLLNDCPLNLIDLYYAEKFCRTHNVRQVIVDLHLDRFIDSGDYIPYMEKYQINNLGIVSLHWLIEQCHSFPVLGGDYSWPLLNIGKLQYSPKSYSNYTVELFMRDNNIPGISNFIGHSIESNNWFLREHIRMHDIQRSEDHFKANMIENLGFGKLEPRMKSNGWELLYYRKHLLNIQKTKTDFYQNCRDTKSTIKWNQNLADLIGGEPGENSDRYLPIFEKTVDIVPIL
jgi:hypothetical protein